jgi:hypothetical protein
VQSVNGVPIADKRQGAVIPAGDTGRATWALRLADEGGGGSTITRKTGWYAWNRTAASINLLAWGFAGPISGFPRSVPVLDLTNPSNPTALADGIYSFSISIGCGSVAAAGNWWQPVLNTNNTGDATTFGQRPKFPDGANNEGLVCNIACTRYLLAGDHVSFTVQFTGGGAKNFFGLGIIEYIAA